MTSVEVAPLAIKCVIRDVLERAAGDIDIDQEPIRLTRLSVVHDTLIEGAEKIAREIARTKRLLKEADGAPDRTA